MKQLLLILAACVVPFGRASSQNPGQNIAVDVQITSVSQTSDTAGISYTVAVLSGSTEPFGRFSVDAPGGVLRIATPSPTNQWATSLDFAGRPLAHWVGGMIPAGSSTPQLHFDAVGLPGILTYWVGGVFTFPSREEADASVPSTPLTSEMITGQTVGIEPWPADRSAQGLVGRLRTLTQSACSSTLLWVNSSALCNDLVADLDQTEAYRASGQVTAARSSLGTFIGRITGSSGGFAPGVTSAGYWLLKSNADIVIALL
jgi:hypothetical protein